MRKHLTDEEFAKLKAYLADASTAQARIIELIALTGMRQAEACGLTADDLDQSAQCLKVRSLKDSRPRLVPLAPAHIARLTPLFARLARERVSAGQLVSDSLAIDTQTRRLREAWQRICQRVFNAYPVPLHGLRHSFVLRIFRSTKENLIVTQKLVGHKNVNSTVRYLDYFQTLDCRSEVLKANGN